MGCQISFAPKGLFSVVTMVHAILSCLIISADAMTCPGSPAALVHCGMKITTTAQTSCAVVKQEMADRVAGKNGWYDQHNRGTYTAQSYGGDFSASRLTGNGKYTDKMIFDLKSDGSNCIIEACSESQVTSVADGGGNYCELKLLFCSSAEGCKVANSDFATSGEKTEKRAGASIGLSNCLVSESAPAITTTATKTNDGSCGPTQPSTVVDCQNVDFGTCGNACCKLDVVVPVSTDVAMNTLNKTLSGGGPDGLYELQMTAEGTLGFGDLKQFGSPLGKDWIGHIYHSTSYSGYTDTLNYNIADNKDGTSTIRAFSTPQIGGALGDNGQSYKNLIYGLKAAFGNKIAITSADGSCGGAGSVVV